MDNRQMNTKYWAVWVSLVLGMVSLAQGAERNVRALEDRAFQASTPVFVDESVGEDPEQPRLQVRAGVELVPRPHRLQEGVLNQVLRLGGVPSQLAGDRVERIEMTYGLLGEAIDFLGFLRKSLGGVGSCHRAAVPFSMVPTRRLRLLFRRSSTTI